MAIAVDDIRYLDGAAGGKAVGRDQVRSPAGGAGVSALHRPGYTVGARSGHMQRRRRAALLVLAAALAVAGITPAFIGSDSGGRLTAQVDGAVTAAQPRPIIIPAGQAGAGAASAVVIGDGQSVWDAVAPYTPDGTSVHEWVASVLQHNDLDAGAVPAGTLVRLP